MDRGAFDATVRGRSEDVQADAEARVVEADLGQDAGLGERREPTVLVLDAPDQRRVRAVRVPVPVLGEQAAGADDAALRGSRPREDLGAGVDGS